MKQAWEPVIGLEIHAQLMCRSKIFSGAATAYGAAPNTQACAVDLGLPGVLPVINASAIDMAARFGLAIGAKVAPRSTFARKNYFYPDLPKGYQISQFDEPIVSHGTLAFCTDGGTTKHVRISRAHLEEDAGKSIHDAFPGLTALDLNRAGTPLLEIVSEPDLRSAVDAVAYMRELHTLVQYLDICDGNMQEGSFRCDANVSVRPQGDDELGTRTETKNLNSFRYVQRAIEIEIERQIEILEGGGEVEQETRLYDAERDETRNMRSKEDAHDYRYFPDPDLLPVAIDAKTLEQISRSLPELPAQKRERYAREWKLGEQDIRQLTASPDVAAFFEQAVEKAKQNVKLVANWVTGDFFAALNRADMTVNDAPIKPHALADLINRIEDKTISNSIGKQVFEAMWDGAGCVDDIIDARGLRQVTDTAIIEPLVDEVIAASDEQVAQYRAGKTKVFAYFVGQVMKRSRGKADPAQVNALLKSKLDA